MKHPWMNGIDLPLRRTRRMSEPRIELSQFRTQKGTKQKKKSQTTSKPCLGVITEE